MMGTCQASGGSGAGGEAQLGRGAPVGTITRGRVMDRAAAVTRPPCRHLCNVAPVSTSRVAATPSRLTEVTRPPFAAGPIIAAADEMPQVMVGLEIFVCEHAFRSDR